MTKRYTLSQSPEGRYTLMRANPDYTRGVPPLGTPGEGAAYWERIIESPPEGVVIIKSILYIRDDSCRFRQWLTKGSNSRVTGDYLRKVALIPKAFRDRLPDNGWWIAQLSF